MFQTASTESNGFVGEWRRRESNPRTVPNLFFVPGGFRSNKQFAARRALIVALEERDGHDCFYCGGSPARSVDHVTPRPWGSDHIDNLVLCCSTCNLRKRQMAGWFYIFWRWARYGDIPSTVGLSPSFPVSRLSKPNDCPRGRG